MRRSVFFAVCLGLVLSLLKEAPAETPAGTTVTPSSIPTGNSTDTETAGESPAVTPSERAGNGTDSGTEPDPPVVKPPEPSGNGTDSGTEPDPPVVKPPEPSGNGTDSGTEPDPPVVKPPEPSGNGTDSGTEPDPPVVKPPEPSGNGTGNGTEPDPPVVKPPEPSGNGTDSGTEPDPPVVKPPEPSGNGTGNGTEPDPPVVKPPEPSGNGTDSGTEPDPPVVKPPEPSGNGTGNGTKPDPPVVEPPESSGNGTGNGTKPDPPVVEPPESSGNGTGNGTKPDPPVVEPPESSGNGTGNGTKPDPPVVEPPESSGNGTGNGTKPDPPVVEPPESSGNGTGNGTKPDPPVVEPPESSGNGTGNGTKPDPPVVEPPEPSVDFCHGDPCRTSSATCVSLQSGYICVCQYGYYYRNESCQKGKIYPVSIAVNASYSENLQIANSTEFQELLNNVTEFFREAFTNLSGYTETVIRKIQPLSESRSADAGLNVTVTNLFTKNSNVTKATVMAAIEEAIKNDPSFVGSWEEGRHCDIYKCDLRTTTCVEEKGEEEGEEFPECKCKPDLEKTEWDDRSCSVCSQNCSAAKHKYCVQEEGGPTCKCMINFRSEAEECVACSVGYSGEECTDNSELILIIVGTVFGAIILCLVIAVSVVSVRAKHKQNPEKRSLMKSGYSDMNASEDRPSMFPRVQTTSGHANPGYQPNNPYEMRSANRDRFPERDYDDLYEISREPTGFRTQSRY